MDSYGFRRHREVGVTSTAAQAVRAASGGRVRWVVCGLLFFATTVNYMDRQVIGILKPTLQRELGWSEADFGWVVSAFQAAYALTMPFAGRLMDRLGSRAGYALAVAVWSLASMSHSLARTLGQFALARIALGVGEAANFPAAVKTVAEWFPRKERALATGIFNSGSNVGAMTVPLLVPAVAALLGWRAVFVVTGALDVLWLAIWLGYYRRPEQHRRLSPAEFAYIRADGPEEEAAAPVRYRHLLGERAAWAFIAAKVLTDPVWWFYLFWLPGFLHSTYGLNLLQLGPPLVVVYLAADLGSIGGGWIASPLVSRGWAVNRARKTAMLICACGALPVLSLLFVHNLWLAVGLVALATASHQGWSANLFTMVSDTFPRNSVASVVGLGGFAGTFGASLIAPAVGYWLDFSKGSYQPLFVGAAVAYVSALAIVHAIMPKLELEARA